MSEFTEPLSVTFTHYPVEGDERVDPNGCQAMLCELRRSEVGLVAHLAVGALYHWRLQTRVTKVVDEDNYLQVMVPEGYSHGAMTTIGSWPRRIELGNPATMLVITDEHREGPGPLLSARDLGWRIGYKLLAACKMALDNEPSRGDERYDGVVGEEALREVDEAARRGLLIHNSFSLDTSC